MAERVQPHHDRPLAWPRCAVGGHWVVEIAFQVVTVRQPGGTHSLILKRPVVEAREPSVVGSANAAQFGSRWKPDPSGLFSQSPLEPIADLLAPVWLL